MNLFLGVFGLKKEKLGGDQAGAVILDRTGDEDHPLLEQARIDVVGALAAGGLLDHHRHQRVHIDVAWVVHQPQPFEWDQPNIGCVGALSIAHVCA